jgi:hypothetical protein
MIRYALLSLFAFATATFADVESGPKEGEKAAELEALGVVGLNAGKEADFVAERKDDVTVYLFINAEKFDRPMNQFIKKLDAALPGVSDKAASVGVWVNGDKDKLKDRLAAIQKSVMYENTSLAIYDGNVADLKGWAINTSAHLTAVVVHKGKVLKSFAYESVNGTDVKAVEDVLKGIKK